MGIEIRPYEPTDAPALHAAGLESVSLIFPWLPWCHPRYSLEEAEQWCMNCPRLFAEGREYNFVITDDGGAFLGGCGLNLINRLNRFANLGYWVRASAMGKGVTPLAVRRLREWAFQHTDLERLEIICGRANVRSQRVAEKAGAVREGILRSRILLHEKFQDVVMYSFIRSEWELSHAK